MALDAGPMPETTCRPGHTVQTDQAYKDQDARLSILANGSPEGRIRLCRQIKLDPRNHLPTGRAIRFGRARGFRVRPDRSPVQEHHAEIGAPGLRPFQQALPNAEARPSDEDLRRFPPRPQLCRDRTPFRTVSAPPDDCLHGAAQVRRRYLGVRTTGLDQRLQHRPLSIRENHSRLRNRRDDIESKSDVPTKRRLGKHISAAVMLAR